MLPEDSKQDFNAKELLNEHGKDISGLGDKVSKCYSSERYEEFQEVVEKIVLRKIDSTEGGEKIKKHTEDYFKGKVVWAVLIWLITIIGTALLQKYFKILG